MNPKIHVTDNWPVNEDLFRIIYGVGIILRLGIFHFIQRITNTLRKEHPDFGIACSELSECIFFEDPGDVRNVELELKHGTTKGGRRGKGGTAKGGRRIEGGTTKRGRSKEGSSIKGRRKTKQRR